VHLEGRKQEVPWRELQGGGEVQEVRAQQARDEDVELFAHATAPPNLALQSSASPTRTSFWSFAVDRHGQDTIRNTHNRLLAFCTPALRSVREVILRSRGWAGGGGGWHGGWHGERSGSGRRTHTPPESEFAESLRRPGAASKGRYIPSSPALRGVVAA
jgi:hypothetical protein